MFNISSHLYRVPGGAFVALLMLAACHKEPPSTSKQPADALVVPRPRSDVPLAARLAHEAENRPASAIRVGDVFAAMRSSGVTITSARQVLGETLGASYCETGLTNKGVALAVCEFPDPESAALGKARSHAMFDKLIKNRVLTVNGQTLFTVVAPAAAGTETQRLVERFASL